MIVGGEFRVPAPRAVAWQHLSDLPGLVPLLPGCDAVEAAGEGQYRVVAHARVGPIKSRIEGTLSVVEAVAGDALKLRVEGQDRLTGSHVRTVVEFRLIPVSDGETEVRYSADIIVSGRLGAIGQGILHATIATMLAEFVRRLTARVAGATVEPVGLGVPPVKASIRLIKTGRASLFDRKGQGVLVTDHDPYTGGGAARVAARGSRRVTGAAGRRATRMEGRDE